MHAYMEKACWAQVNDYDAKQPVDYGYAVK